MFAYPKFYFIKMVQYIIICISTSDLFSITINCVVVFFSLAVFALVRTMFVWKKFFRKLPGKFKKSNRWFWMGFHIISLWKNQSRNSEKYNFFLDSKQEWSKTSNRKTRQKNLTSAGKASKLVLNKYPCPNKYPRHISYIENILRRKLEPHTFNVLINIPCISLKISQILKKFLSLQKNFVFLNVKKIST